MKYMNISSHLLRFLQQQWFILGIIAAIVLGIFFPEISIVDASGATSTVIIMLIFLGTGFTLPSEAISSGVANIKLHLFLQLFIFGFIPFYFLLAVQPFDFDPHITIGIFALAVLPTTISSCIVFTHVFGGNVVGTMFNAVFANSAGVFLSPLLLSLLIQRAGGGIPLDVLVDVVIGLAWKILLPVAAGQVLHRRFRQRAEQQKKRVGKASNILIILIVLFSMAKSASRPSFFDGLKEMGTAVIVLAISFYILLYAGYALSRVFRYSRPDTISILFAAPQKTMALGVPLLTIFFSYDPEMLGIILMPLLFYHPWQLLNAGLIKQFPFIRKVLSE
jgi:solute carrier family 10 (sodium/bile acid cotransporter), member 7